MKIKILLTRLHNICIKSNSYYNLWWRGIEVIERKYNCKISLANFKPSGLVQEETSEITIKPIVWEYK